MADFKESVRVAATANVTVATALNAGDSLDGVTLANGDRVLLPHQTTKSQNGIWVVGAEPVRSTDADAAGELSGGTMVYVEQGTRYGDRVMRITTDGSITPGTTAHDWAPLAPKTFHGRIETTATEAKILTGSGGYTVKRVGAGQLEITLSTALAEIPTVQVSAEKSGAFAVAQVVSVTTSVIRVNRGTVTETLDGIFHVTITGAG